MEGEEGGRAAERAEILNALIARLGDAQFAYVFGSFDRPAFSPDSDIDLAVCFQRPLDTRAWSDLACRLEEAAHRRVDLVDLRTADPIICMQVLRNGRVIWRKDPHALALFQMTALSRYQDFKLSRRGVEEAMWAKRTA